jgi:hypothetical protein
MSVQDITPESVLTAIHDGHDDIYKLSAHFGVLATPSSTLWRTMCDLKEADRIVLMRLPTHPLDRWVVA